MFESHEYLRVTVRSYYRKLLCLSGDEVSMEYVYGKITSPCKLRSVQQALHPPRIICQLHYTAFRGLSLNNSMPITKFRGFIRHELEMSSLFSPAAQQRRRKPGDS